METQIIETADEKRKRINRERQRKHRAKNEEPKGIDNFAQISKDWVRNEKQLLAADPALHARLLARHNEVVELEAEVVEILKGVGIYTWPPSPMKRAETLSANTLNPSEIFPMPDICFADVKADVLKNGVANYYAIEAASVKGEQLDAEGDRYWRFGFRSRLSQNALQNVREALALYALTTKDASLNQSVVEEAIADCIRLKVRNAELCKLIERQASIALPVGFIDDEEQEKRDRLFLEAGLQTKEQIDQTIASTNPQLYYKAELE